MKIEEAKKLVKGLVFNDDGTMVSYIDFTAADYDTWGGYTLKEYAEAIETLLTAYEKEKEDNKELRKYYATRKEVEELKEINECLHDSAENYVHKDKVIAKVIEIKDRPVKDEFITATQGKLNTIIDIESLLDEEE